MIFSLPPWVAGVAGARGSTSRHNKKKPENENGVRRVAETMFSKIFGERNSTKTSKYYF
jgi:hypothetical protein